MRPNKSRMGRILRLTPILLLAAVVALTAVSCGGTAEETQEEEYSVKYPPGTAEEDLTATTDSGGVIEAQGASEEEEEEEEAQDTGTDSTAAAAEVAAYFDGIYISIPSAARQDSNATVASSGTREVEGDFLEIELAMENVSDELVDLSDYSFRLWNPAIDADLYYDYYGNSGTYGKYVSENIISATLLDYATLQTVTYKLKIGESVEDVFLFFDLNPCNTALNEGFLMEYTNLIIHNDSTGEEAQVNLAAFAA